MSIQFDPTIEIRRLLQNPRGGVVEVADHILQICRQHHVQLDWLNSELTVQVDGGPKQLIGGENLRKSVFRAILARIATISSIAAGDAASLYEFKGQITLPGNPPTITGVEIINSAAQQRLILEPIQTP